MYIFTVPRLTISLSALGSDNLMPRVMDVFSKFKQEAHPNNNLWHLGYKTFISKLSRALRLRGIISNKQLALVVCVGCY